MNYAADPRVRSTRKSLRKRIRAFLAMALTTFVAIAAGPSACSLGAPTSTAKPSADVFRLGWSAYGNESLSPASTSTNTQVIYLDPLFDYLLYMKRGTGTFERDEGTGLATKVVQSSD